MEQPIQQITDEQAIDLLRDFVDTQEKLKRDMQQAKERGVKNPQFHHYTLANGTIEDFRRLFAA